MKQIIHNDTSTLDLSDRSWLGLALEAQISQFLDGQVTATNGIGQEYGELMADIRTLVMRGGKRLRPLLVAWSYAGFGGNNVGKILKAAASQELLHAGILMHDDIIDRDLTRWAGPNISGVYLPHFEASYSAARARHLADSCALMAGDGCIDLSYRQFLDSGFSAQKLLDGLQLMHKTFSTMLGGEYMDLMVSLRPLEKLESDDLLKISEYKTAAYSFSMPLELGALLAGASSASRANLRELGTNLGIAYQLQDDILGMFGDSAHTGKPVLSDLREGKRTLLVHAAYQGTTLVGRRFFDTWLGNAEAGPAELARVRTLVRDSGALGQIETLAMSYHQQATQLIPTIGWQAPYDKKLADVFASLLNRAS